MKNDHRILVETLIRTLGSAASYNDKGYIWSGHTNEQQEKFLAQLQAELDKLAEQLGPDALGQELSNGMSSGDAVYDASGRFVLLARERFPSPGSPRLRLAPNPSFQGTRYTSAVMAGAICAPLNSTLGFYREQE